MVDPATEHLTVTTNTRFPKTGKAVSVKTYSFYLGDNGPFKLEYTAGQDTPEKIEADIAAEAAKLRALGALPPITY